MSHIETLEPKHHSFRILFGQIPLTKFKDYRKSIFNLFQRFAGTRCRGVAARGQAAARSFIAPPETAAHAAAGG